MYIDYKATVWCRIPIHNEEALNKAIELLKNGSHIFELYDELDTEHDIGCSEILDGTEEFIEPVDNNWRRTIEIFKDNQVIYHNE